jgi:hypothetical protein
LGRLQFRPVQVKSLKDPSPPMVGHRGMRLTVHLMQEVQNRKITQGPDFQAWAKSEILSQK